MAKENYSNGKVFRNMDEFERAFFPETYRKKQQEELESNPKKFGKHLAKDFLDGVREGLKEIVAIEQ